LIDKVVIARSASDEAIQPPAQAPLDCFAVARNDEVDAKPELIQLPSQAALDCFAVARNDEIGAKPEFIQPWASFPQSF
jgi:hypothetical protein